MKRVFGLVAIVAALLISGCSKINERIDNLDNRLEKLEGTTLPSINEQIESINASIADLKVVDTELHNLIEALEADAVEHSELIAALQTKASELESKITVLEEYVDSEITATEDWAAATFATLEQYAEVQSEISTLKALIEQNKSDITEAYTTAIAEAIATSEGSMKEWVSEQLAGYYTIAETDAKLELLQSSIDTLSESLAEEVETLSGRIETMKSELTEAYEAAITEAIETNNGVINSKIAEEINSVNSRIDEEVASINARIDALEGRIKDLEDALDKIKALDIVFDIENGEACMAGASIEFGYTIVGGDEDTEVESFGDGGWRADVTPTDATSGRIRVTAPKDGGNGKVIVLATSGAGASAMKSIRFDEGVIADILDSYEVDWEACTLEVKLRTNLDYTVRIPAEAQSWVSVADTRAEIREESVTFRVTKNTSSEPRVATVELVNALGETLQSFEITQKMQPLSEPIQFADQNVKQVCVEKFDTNGDGELSYQEAAQVKVIKGNYPESFFGDYAHAVKSFDELQYFVNLKTIGYYAFEGCQYLTSITIPDGVTSIEGSTFSGCSSLTSITIPNSVTSIGWDAFRDCSSLTSITIPDGVTSIGYSAFSGCSSLTSITIPDGVTSIGGAAFSGCSSLTSITIPDGVVSIGDNAFSGCSSLTSITIPDGVTSIGDCAFYDCSSLISITIPDGVTSIEGSTFSGCGSLTSITIPDGVTSIRYSAFSGCSSLTSITIPDGVTSIEDRVFYDCSSLTSITFPDSVTSIGDCAFYDCSSLTSITIPDGVASIGGAAFSGCSSLTSITILDGVTSIGDHAFNGCNSLTRVTIPDSVTSIGYAAFNGCSSLTSITIPDGAASIGGSAFYECSNLKSVYCYATTPPQGRNYMFEHNASERIIYVPEEAVDQYKEAEFWEVYASSITAIPEPLVTNKIQYAATAKITPKADAFNGTIVSHEYDSSTGYGTITLDKNLKKINAEAFKNCTSLKNISLVNSVTSIGDQAFYGCTNLEQIACYPKRPPTLGNNVFGNNTKLTKINVQVGYDKVYKSADGWKEYSNIIVGYLYFDNLPGQGI